MWIVPTAREKLHHFRPRPVSYLRGRRLGNGHVARDILQDESLARRDAERQPQNLGVRTDRRRRGRRRQVLLIEGLDMRRAELRKPDMAELGNQPQAEV